MADISSAPAPVAAPVNRSWAMRLLDTDIWHSFKRSRITMLAAFVTLAFFAAAILAGVVTPQNPFDPAQLELLNSRIPPIWEEQGQQPYLLGTDEQGRDVFSAIL